MTPPTSLAALPAAIAVLATALMAPLQLGAAGLQSERALAAGEVDHHTLLSGLERQRASAILRRDTAALRNLMDRQYYHVDSRGRVRSKTELLTALERDRFRFQVYEIESTEVQLLEGGSAAMVTGTVRTLQAGAAARPFRGRYAHLWVRHPEGWKSSFHQTTEIRPAADD